MTPDCVRTEHVVRAGFGIVKASEGFRIAGGHFQNVSEASGWLTCRPDLRVVLIQLLPAIVILAAAFLPMPFPAAAGACEFHGWSDYRQPGFDLQACRNESNLPLPLTILVNIGDSAPCEDGLCRSISPAAARVSAGKAVITSRYTWQFRILSGGSKYIIRKQTMSARIFL